MVRAEDMQKGYGLGRPLSRVEAQTGPDKPLSGWQGVAGEDKRGDVNSRGYAIVISRHPQHLAGLLAGLATPAVDAFRGETPLLFARTRDDQLGRGIVPAQFVL